MRTSVWTYAALGRLLRRLAPSSAASLVGLDFDSARAWPVYNWIGPCKAALRSLHGYLAHDLGAMGARANLVAAGPLRTRAASGISDFEVLVDSWDRQAPLAWDPTDASAVADAVCFLLSDLARAIAGEVLTWMAAFTPWLPAWAAVGLTSEYPMRGSGGGDLATSGRRKAGDELEQLADAVGLFDGVAQRPIGVDLVVVSAAHPGSLHVAVPHKISNDRLSRALGDPDSDGNIPAADAGVTGDADQHMAVVGEERPAGPRRVLGCSIGVGHVLHGSGFVKQRTGSNVTCLTQPPDFRGV